MAVMQALLQIKADVTGEGQVDKLGRALGGLQQTAGKVSGGLKGLLGAAGGLSGALGGLASVVTGAGLVAMAKGAIDAADNLNDLSQKTGVSVAQLSKFQQAAEMSGTSIDVVGGALIKLSKNMVASMGEAANAAGESAEEIKDRTKRETDQAVDAVKLNMDRQVDAIKEGERKQLDAVKDSADKKIAALERESDARLDELNRRYRQEQKLLDDKYEDEADLQEEAAEGEQRTLERAIEKRYDTQIEAIQEDKNLSKEARKSALEALQAQKGDELDMLRDRFEAEAKARRRALRDREEIEREGIEKRKKAEETALKNGFDRQREVVEKGAEAQKQAISKAAEGSVEAVKRGAEASIVALKAAMDPVGALSDDMDELGLSGKAASKAFAELGINIKDQAGNLRNPGEVMLDVADALNGVQDPARKSALAMQIFGKSGANIIPFLNMGRAEIEKLVATFDGDFAQAADAFNDRLPIMQARLSMLGVAVAEALMPALQGIADLVIAAADGFSKLPGPVQAVVGGVVALTAAFVLLAPAILAASQLLGGLAALKIGATIAGWLGILVQVGPTIAGWLGIIGPVLTAITGLFTGLLAFLTGTVLPALIAFFSGPVGWTVLAIAAVVAMAIAFREPIMEFLTWLAGAFMEGLKVVGKVAYDVFLKPWVELFKIGMRAPISEMWKWLQETWNKGVQFITTTIGKIADAAKAPFLAVVETIRSAFNSVLSTIGRGINIAIGAINSLIAAFNRLPAPDIPYVPSVSVPQFAEGGVVNRPTLAMIGEGGEREYIIPESKMGAAAAAYMSGARGSSVLSPSTINVTTGPVMQQQGQQWVTMADLQRAMRATEAGTLARIRTPAGRSALGIR